MQAELESVMQDIASQNPPDRTKEIWDGVYDAIAAYADYPVFNEFNDAVKAASTTDHDVQRVLSIIEENLHPDQEQSYQLFHSLSDEIELRYHTTDANFNEAVFAL